MFLNNKIKLNKLKISFYNEIKINKNNYYKSTSCLDEIKKFDKFSSEFNWFTSEITKPLRNLNILRIPLIKNQFFDLKNEINTENEFPLTGLNFLDVGCGGGLLSEPLANLGANVTAIDANSKSIEFAKNHLNIYSNHLKNKLNYANCDLETLNPNKKNYFDAVIASEILEHVNSIELFIKCANSLLKKNGLFFITTINQSLQSYLFIILLAENLLNLVPKRTHFYNKLVSINGLRLILEDNNFSIRLVHGMRFNPITKQWSWIKNTSMNYALIAQKNN